MVRACLFLALVFLTACPKRVEGSLAKTTVFLSHEIQNVPAEGNARDIAVQLLGHLREQMRSAGYQLVSNEGLPHDLRLQLRTDFTNEMFGAVGGSAHMIVQAGDQVIDQVDVLLPSNTVTQQDAQIAYYLAVELSDRLTESARAAAFASGVKPLVATPTAPADVPAAPGSLLVGAPQPNAWALVVGIEKYRDAPAASGARADAEAFSQLASKSLGIPEEHIQVALDDRASRGDLEKHLKWLSTNVQAGGRIYLFFSGHGAPEPTSGTSYLLPYDGDPRALDETALKLSEVVASLNATKSREVLVMLDSCFSGSGGRSVLPAGARPLVPISAPPSAPKVALFTAAAAAEISGPSADGKHGLFTATVLEAIGTGKADTDGDGQLSLRELADWVQPRVSRQAKKDLREQTPSLTASGLDAASFLVTSGLK